MKWIVTGTYQVEVEADDEDDAVEAGIFEFTVEISSGDMEWTAEAAQRQGEGD